MKLWMIIFEIHKLGFSFCMIIFSCKFGDKISVLYVGTEMLRVTIQHTIMWTYLYRNKHVIVAVCHTV